AHCWSPGDAARGPLCASPRSRSADRARCRKRPPPDRSCRAGWQAAPDRRLRDAERRQRLGGDDPGRDAGMDAFREERTERLIFPALYVACRPVVEQAEPDQMIGGLRYRNRRAQRIAGADPETELELVIEAARRAEARLRLLGPLALA